MSVFLDWKHISAENVANLEECCNEEGVKSLLFNIFGVKEYREEKQEIMVDFHFQNYAFCKRSAFDARQTSTFLSIMYDVLLEDAQSSTLTNNVEKSFKRFQSNILKHSVERPPKSVQIFQPADVEPIVNFAMESYFRSYNLYIYVFGVQTLLTIKQVGAGGVELPRVPMALSEGRPITPPASSEADQAEQELKQ